MDIRFDIGPVRVYIGVKRMTWVDGVNSKLEDGQHFLQWDFDGVKLNDVYSSLWAAQFTHDLPPVYILSTGKPDAYHAYCLKRHDWTKAFEIVWKTADVCNTFVKMAFLRSYFTLRFGPKSGREITFAGYLESGAAEDVDATKIHNFVRYYTKGG